MKVGARTRDYSKFISLSLKRERFKFYKKRSKEIISRVENRSIGAVWRMVPRWQGRQPEVVGKRHGEGERRMMKHSAQSSVEKI